jgi:hypothetical protein
VRIRSVARGSVVAFALAALPVVSTAGTPAAAACAEVGQISYAVSSPAKTWLPTNLRSDYLKGPGTITYSKTTTSTVSASITGTTSVEAGVIFAKASASIGVTVGGSYSKSGSWSYSATVPKGETKRLQQHKEGRQFTVKKKRIVAPCNVQAVWTKTVKAPVTSNATYLWKLTS